LRSRLGAVEELNAAIVSGGAAAAMRASQEEKLPAGLAMVRDAVRIKPGFERAIEAALESRLEDLIASDPRAIFEILDYLAANNSGRAVVWPPHPTGPAQRVSCPPPAVAAVDVVECEARHRQVVDHLLARVIIAPDRASALSVRDSLPEPCLVATLQGEVFYPGGAVAGGSRAVPRLSLLRETEEIRAELAAREQEAEQQADRSREAAVAAQSASEAIAATSARIAELEAALAAARVSLTTAEADAAQAKESAASLQEECVRLEAERDESQQNCAELEKEIGAANQRLAALEQAAGFIEQSGSCAGRAR
jgi:chromosome segregation protein